LQVLAKADAMAFDELTSDFKSERQTTERIRQQIGIPVRFKAGAPLEQLKRGWRLEHWHLQYKRCLAPPGRVSGGQHGMLSADLQNHIADDALVYCLVKHK
jgi:hypothetical protein